MKASFKIKQNRVFNPLRRFLRREQGGSSLMVGFMIVPLIAAIGLATDASRGFLVKSRLSSSLDAAALAGGKVYFADDRDSDIEGYFNANYPSDFMNGQLSPLQIVEQKAPGEPERLQLSASVILPTLFMHLVGIDEMSISARTEITRVMTGLQVALVLDNTGSMKGQKLADLQAAAKDFVDTLFGPNTSAPNPNLSISVVPYSQTVNVGDLGPAYVDMTGVTYDPSDPDAWHGCVDSRATLPTLDADPTVLDSGAYDISVDDVATGGRWKPYRSQGPSANPPGTPGGKANAYCPEELMGFKNDHGTITNYLDNKLAARGNTHSNMGMVWGWRVLDPQEPFANGVPYGDPFTEKAIVLMTDGMNTPPSASNYTGYGTLPEARLGSNQPGPATQRLDQRMAKVCEAVKARGVTVYTIVFGMDAVGNPNLNDLYESCATDPSKFFAAAQGDDLSSAFDAIANDLANLHLSR